VAEQEISGKVFRFLSAMHPSLSKAERKRYAGYDPDNWYPWTTEMSAELTELMRRSPRDTSFARGFAYVSQKAVAEGEYITTRDFLAHIGSLPSAYRAGDGSGFKAFLNGSGKALVSYSGMPGFSNVCIAVQGELQQRLDASGALSGQVGHGKVCRLNGDDHCEFELTWSGESAPAGARPANLSEFGGADASARPAPAAKPATESKKPAPKKVEKVAVEVRESELPKPNALPEIDMGGGEDLFDQIKKRLAEAERQAKLYGEARAEIDNLNRELAQSRADFETSLAESESARADLGRELTALKEKIRGILSDS